jgi:lysophospholipid acyltransferase (LPLAT)-like uncharacterized protein
LSAGDARADGRQWSRGDESFLKFFSGLGCLMLRALGASWRVRWVGREHTTALRSKGQNWIYAFWHGGLLALVYTHRRQGIKVLVSTHRDGELVARVITKLGFTAVRGSTTRGGGRALFTLAGLKEGAPLGVAPDGPRGPARRVHPGVVYLAQRAGLPIVPLTSASAPCWKARSWDRFTVPLPMSRCAVGYGEPMWIPPDAKGPAMEELRAELESRLNALQRELDWLVEKGGASG